MKTLSFLMAACFSVVACLTLSHTVAAHTPSFPVQEISPDTNQETSPTLSPGWLIFDAGSAALSENIKQSLAKLAAQMKALGGARVVIVTQGGGTGTQQKINEERAQAIVQYVVANYGISTDRFASTVSDGIDDPNAVNYHQEP